MYSQTFKMARCRSTDGDMEQVDLAFAELLHRSRHWRADRPGTAVATSDQFDVPISRAATVRRLTSPGPTSPLASGIGPGLRNEVN
jgi:hypothetical protein